MIKKSQYEMLIQCAKELCFGKSKNTKSAFDDIFESSLKKLAETHTNEEISNN